MGLDPRRLKELFVGASALADAGQRSAWLVEQCRDQPELLAKVEALLQARDRPESFLDVLAEPAVAPLEAVTQGAYQIPAAGRERAASEQPGSRIGRYKLLQQIGEGGMGTVWMAEQTEAVRRKVAVKIIKAGMDSRHVLARFEAERQALALMDHPSIARVLDAGATPEGRPYFVMELVKGQPITEYCDEHRLSPRQRLELFVPVCQALQHAHQKGIIHRDIKPSNVLVAPYDGRPVIKVIDFGVAKATGQRLTEKTLFTEFGAVVGTLEYMSPEQAELNNQDIDTRSDIYSLGVLLYQLLTGTTPLDRKRLQTTAFMDLLRVIREEDPPRPSTRLSECKNSLPSVSAQRQTEPAKLAKLVRGELDWIVMKALEKDRNRRYETANGLARDIERYLTDETVEACPPSTGYKLRKFARKNRKILVTAAVFVVLLLAAALVSSWQAIRATRAETTARRAQAKAEAISRFLTHDILGQADPGMNARNKQITVEEALDRAAVKLEGAFPDEPEVEAAVRRAVGGSYLGLGLYKKAELHLRKAYQLRQEHLGPDHPETLEAETGLGSLLWQAAKLPEAEAILRDAVERCRLVLGPDDPETLSANAFLASVLRNEGKWAEGEEVARGLLEACCRVSGRAQDTSGAMNILGQILREQGKLDEAGDLFQKCLDMRRGMFWAGHTHLLDPTDSLARLRLLQGRLADAEGLFREIVEAARKTLGVDHRFTLMGEDNLAVVLIAEGRLDEAERLLRQTIAAARRTIGPEHGQTLGTINHLAEVLQARGSFLQAEDLLRPNLATTQRTLGEQNPVTLRAVFDLSTALLAQTKNEEAERLARRCRDLRHRTLPSGHWQTALAGNLLGGCLSALKRRAEAEPLLQDSYRTLKSSPSAWASHRREAVTRLVRLYEEWRKPAQAAKWRVELERLGPHRK